MQAPRKFLIAIITVRLPQSKTFDQDIHAITRNAITFSGRSSPARQQGELHA